MIITGPQLQEICKTLSSVRADNIAALLTSSCPIYGIDTPDIFHEFIATLAHESNEFSSKSENLNYSARRIVEVWPTRFKTLKDAIPFQYKAKLLANKVYGGRKDLGNKPGTDDGYNMRGSGYIQMTGRGMAEAYKKYRRSFFANNTAEEVMDMVRSIDAYAIDSACWVFAIAKGLIPLAIADNMKEVTRRINGALIGFPSRMIYYERAKKAIV